MKRAAALLATFLFTSAAFGEDVRVATWNIGWLTDRASSVETAPGRKPVYQRSEADYAALHRYATELNADILAMEEVDGVNAAAHVASTDEYQLFSTGEDDIQRPVLAVRKGIKVEQHPDLVGLDLLDGQPHSLRRGLDATITLKGKTLRVLVVHLKSGCFNSAMSGEACALINRQAPILKEWIDARQTEGQGFMILGDFNRRLRDENDPIRRQLDDGPRPLTWISDAPSACWGGKYPEPIDHILLGEDAATRVSGKATTLVYKETDTTWRDKLSDHCPVSVTLRY